MPRILAVLLALILAAATFADGKMFGSVGDLKQPGIAHQRAVLSWHDGEQTLIVENTVENQRDAAWLLPVPGKPTQIEALPSGYFTLLSSRYSIPLISHSFFFAPSVVVFLVLLLGILTVPDRKSPKSMVLHSSLVGVIALLLCAIFFPVFASSDSSIGPSPKFAFTAVADYEVAVIPLTDTEAGIAWLRRNHFKVTKEEEGVMRAYAQDGWYFAAARLRGSAELHRPHPLMIRCKAPVAVYPMALTGLQGGPLNLELYVVGKGSARAPRMTVASTSIARKSPASRRTVFPERSIVTRLIGRYDLSSRTKDIRISWGGKTSRSISYWTPVAKQLTTAERILLAASLSLIVIAPFLVRRFPYRKTILSSLAIGLLAGLAWSIPIFLAPTAEPGKDRIHRAAIVSEIRQAQNIAETVLEAETAADARAIIADRREDRYSRGTPLLADYILFQESDNVRKVITLDLSGEPIIQEKPISPSPFTPAERSKGRVKGEGAGG